MFPSSGARTALAFVLPLLVMLAIVKGNPIHKKELDRKENATTRTMVSPASPWFNRVTKPNPRVTGCWNRPWICNEGGGKFPPVIKKLCCKNRCVDVTTDMNNCGLCGIRCPFTWQCCYGLCINTNVNPFHCGKCANRCPFGSLCVYGMCGYAQPLPPFPFPFPPKLPFPPFPFPPKKPLPPFPFPFPPKPPKPFPPKPPKPYPPFPKENTH